MPDLAYMNESIYQSFEDIVLQGVLSSNGMPNFQGELTSGQVLNIRSYILVQAKKKGQSSAGKAVQ